MTIINGFLEPYISNETEGIIWAISENNTSSYDSLHFIDEYDFLLIHDKIDPSILVWSSYIIKDYSSHKTKRPFSDYYQQSILGYWIHWLPFNEPNPEQWATYFLDEYPATLFKS